MRPPKVFKDQAPPPDRPEFHEGHFFRKSVDTCKLTEKILQRLPKPSRTVMQGSVQRDTYLRDSSDVDMLVCRYDPHDLWMSDRDHSWRMSLRLRSEITDLFSQLPKKVVRRIRDTDESIGITYQDERYVDIDVVPAIDFVELDRRKRERRGVWIWSRRPDGRGIGAKSYPYLHEQGLDNKNSDCSGTFDVVAQACKEAMHEVFRNRSAVTRSPSGDHCGHDQPAVSSFLMESMLFNVPSEKFSGISPPVNWLADRSVSEMRRSFRSPDGVYLLFEDNPGDHCAGCARRAMILLRQYLDRTGMS